MRIKFFTKMDSLPLDLIHAALFPFLTPADVYFFTLTKKEWNKYRNQVFILFKRHLKARLGPLLPLHNHLSPSIVLTGSMVIQICQGIEWKDSEIEVFMEANVTNAESVDVLFQEIPRLAVYCAFGSDSSNYPMLETGVYPEEVEFFDLFFSPNVITFLPHNRQCDEKPTVKMDFVFSKNQKPQNMCRQFDLSICMGFYDGSELELPQGFVFDTFSKIAWVYKRNKIKTIKKYLDRGIRIFQEMSDGDIIEHYSTKLFYE